ncbi:hypothetical protein M407DRAFT_243887 [Tulasnella calospora MUT 4182]|uniref:Uncharacterized protein n=1 Tax=Tulasnella calospora MUT 4182 TaxID=1051891 RepID=A0A0C3PSX7_9AGAM|nr:hypothetical protein M407DRAFT_246639 [Tulasnella calospora MUT 4182]KIO26013.1 hypothetical protein M407DRAFT_243887 [Tulasnella calospora MUT 4182]
MSFATLSSMMPNATSIAYLQNQIISAVPIDIDPRLADSAKSLAFCLAMVASVHGMKVLTRALGYVVETATTDEEEEPPKRGRRMERTRFGGANASPASTPDGSSL